MGESTDIVQKEMFTFEDKGGRSLTLRPEGTAGVCRAYVEHGMHKLPQPVKVWYSGPFFRHEAPQAGRYRQFAQIGAEALGSDDPALDAELILLLGDILEPVDTRLRLSSLGNPETRRGLRRGPARVPARAREPSSRTRSAPGIEQNPLRAFDSDHAGTREVMAGAPRLIDRLDPEDAEHFADVRALLDEAGCEYEVDPALVRGLDYYTRTVFEFESPALGAQSGVGGGGRYDGLVEQLGGPPTPGVGWAAGVERILLASPPDGGPASPPRIYVVVPEPERRAEAFRITRLLRSRGAAAEMEMAGRSVKGQMKQADRIEASQAVIVGDPLEVRDMEQRRAAGGAGRRGDPGAGVTETFSNRYRDTWAGAARADRVDTELRVAGWVHRRRDHGGLIFVDLRDREGILQLVFHPEDAPEAHEAAKRLRAEDVISAAGRLVHREEGTVNPDLPTGEVELAVSAFDLLADAETPPFQIDEDDPVSEELRLRYRYLDLRKPAHGRGHGPAPPGDLDHPPPPRRRGLPRGGDPSSDPLDARGRA